MCFPIDDIRGDRSLACVGTIRIQGETLLQVTGVEMNASSCSA
jgi:hypothetical protein